MIVAFHTNQLGERGTEVALFDFAHYNEALLGNQSIVLTPQPADQAHPDVRKRFHDRFEVIHYKDATRLEKDILVPKGADVFYNIKRGMPDEVDIREVKFCVHAVFRANHPHGDVYAYISEWLARHMAGEEGRWVPLIVHKPASDEDLRSELGIPRDAIVFGRYGGAATFNVKGVREAVLNVARRRRDIHFVLLNTPLRPPRFRSMPENIHFLPVTIDPIGRSRFINTCDAMLHARRSGETFGLACAEFSAHNKPVITYAKSKCKAHIENLQGRAITYRSRRELKKILLGFRRPDPSENWDVVTDAFSPERVMRKFNEVFLAGA